MNQLEKICPECGKQAKRFTKGTCHNCYRKNRQKPKVVCSRCGEFKPNQAFHLCPGCYNSIFHIEKVKRHNRIKIHNIDSELYENITRKCAACGFSKIVELHHLDGDHNNQDIHNLPGLCPNCHSMVENRRFKYQILDILFQKGYTVPDTPKLRFDRKLLEFNGDLDLIRKFLQSGGSV